MTAEPARPRLQAGGTLVPGKHVYVERPEDAELVEHLLAGDYCNVLTSRQMGKSSLMQRATRELAERGVRCVSIDLAGRLGTEMDPDVWYEGLLVKVARDLALGVDAEAWWRDQGGGTRNQKLLHFLEQEVLGKLSQPVVIFLDEIDSTLRLPFTDDLFTAIRTLYNERAQVEAYGRITFCLLGVASPNELIKDRRTTPYNIGHTIELRDFDERRDDLSPLREALDADPSVAGPVLERILRWTGGHPYLTLKLCAALRSRAKDAAGVDRYVGATFTGVEDVAGTDTHFEQVLRFLETRVTHGLATFRLYQKLLKGREERDRVTPAHIGLKLSGLAKRAPDGRLVIRNEIYRSVFDAGWVRGTQALRAARRQRFAMAGISVALLIALVAGAEWKRRSDARAAQQLVRQQLRDVDPRVRLRALHALVADYGWDARRIEAALEGNPEIVGPDTFTEGPWGGDGFDPLGPGQILDVLEGAHAAFVSSREHFGALYYAAEDVARRQSGDPDLHDRALRTRDAIRTAFIDQHDLQPPPAADDARLNPRIRLEGGTFEMGSEEGSSDELPAHRVTLGSFRIQKYEVTNAEYRRFDPSHSSNPVSSPLPESLDEPSHPVVNVSWYEAMAYAAWLDGSLPTEAQWEFAARGEEGRVYPWGDEAPTGDLARFGDLSGGTGPVGSYERGATPQGIHDLAGNVWEWCRDWYAPYEGREQADPIGPMRGPDIGILRENAPARVLRGGSFGVRPGGLRAAFRIRLLPERRYDFIGFRVSWSAPGGP